MKKRDEESRLRGQKSALRQVECNYGRAYHLFQERWVLFTIHHLLEGPLGFNELSRRVGGVNPTTLSQRLLLLEEAGLVSREVQSVMPPKTSYELTEAGRALEPILRALGRWSAQYLPNTSCVLEETTES